MELIFVILGQILEKQKFSFHVLYSLHRHWVPLERYNTHIKMLNIVTLEHQYRVLLVFDYFLNIHNFQENSLSQFQHKFNYTYIQCQQKLLMT